MLSFTKVPHIDSMVSVVHWHDGRDAEGMDGLFGNNDRCGKYVRSRKTNTISQTNSAQPFCGEGPPSGKGDSPNANGSVSRRPEDPPLAKPGSAPQSPPKACRHAPCLLSYCVMSNHFHILLEVPPMPAGGISDAVLLQRLEAIQSADFVRAVADELADARKRGDSERAAAVHARFTYRMHDLSQFMKSLLQRFTRFFNRTHNRSGTLWEERFKSSIA